MRGKEEMLRRNYAFEGITPAYAGKRIVSSRFLPVAWDHPRLCGEKMVVKASKQLKPGSPPPMRGKGKSASRNDFPNRITPAYAGKSL